MADLYATLAVQTGLTVAVRLAFAAVTAEDGDVDADADVDAKVDEPTLACRGSCWLAMSTGSSPWTATWDASLEKKPGPKNQMLGNQLEDEAGALGRGGALFWVGGL